MWDAVAHLTAISFRNFTGNHAHFGAHSFSGSWMGIFWEFDGWVTVWHWIAFGPCSSLAGANLALNQSSIIILVDLACGWIRAWASVLSDASSADVKSARWAVAAFNAWCFAFW